MKQLSTMQVIALTQLNGIGAKTVMRICEILKEKEMLIETEKDMHQFLRYAKKYQIVARLKDISESDIIRAYSVAKRIIEESAANGINAVSYMDEDYPQRLLKTVDEKGNEAIPVVMYYKGDISITHMPSIAIIGTREPTYEGESSGEFLAGEFAKRGFNIISGLAIGCDSCAHRGALNVYGKTTAFLAHGLTTIYPPQNESMAKEIIEKGGLLMSEYPIGTKLSPYNLVARDRLQAGLAMATLVIQTGKKGGTMHAALTTLKANKPLYTVRFKDDATNNHEKCLGNAFLVKRGANYINRSDNLDEISEKIKNWIPFNDSLF